jgi:hypothetical protein
VSIYRNFVRSSPLTCGSFQRHHKPKTISKEQESSTDTSVSVSYKCTCRKNTPVPAVQATSTRPDSVLTALATGAPVPAPLKRRQSDLLEWVGKKSSASPSEAATQATGPCKGKIRIIVEEDNSHPVKGIKGQKITVTIKH